MALLGGTSNCYGHAVTLSTLSALPVPMLRQVSLQGSQVMKTAVFLSFSLFRALQERPEPLNVVPGALWSVSEAILGALFVWAANCRLQAAFGAPRKRLVSIRQLLGTSRRSIPALRKPNGAPRQRNLASREPIVALRKLKTMVSSSH
mgnify:CR=1 FL=1